MLKRGSNSPTKHKHQTVVHFDGVDITLDQMGTMVSHIMVGWASEAEQEWFAQDAACAISQGINKRIHMAKAQAEAARRRREWVKLHPPNHAGFYYCHIGGEWVHIEASDLEHIVPSSRERIDMTVPGWDKKMRMACRPHNSLKGSRQDVPSATLEYAPPDEEC